MAAAGAGLCVVPWHRSERWQELVVVVGVSVVDMMVFCGPVPGVGWVACGGWLRWGVVVIEPVVVAVVLAHQGVGVGRGRGVLMVLVVPGSLALRQWRSLCGLDLCGRWSLAGLLGWAAAVRRWWWALVRVLL